MRTVIPTGFNKNVARDRILYYKLTLGRILQLAHIISK